MIDRSVGVALFSLFKIMCFLIIVFVPLGAWKAIELISALF